MSRISNLFSKHWRNVHLSAVTIICLILIVGGNDVVSPVSRVVYTIAHYPFFKLKSSLDGLQKVADDNLRLQQALVEASLKLSQYEEAVRENERLRKVLGFEASSFDQKIIPAKVVSTQGNLQSALATINRGSRDSIAVDQTVVNQSGLAGRIVSVTPESAIVQLLTHPASRVAARLADNRGMGIIRWDSNEGMKLDNLPVQSDVAEGDLLVSSGLGGIYPAGLKVATITSLTRPADEPFCSVQLEPVVNFNTVEELFVLISD